MALSRQIDAVSFSDDVLAFIRLLEKHRRRIRHRRRRSGYFPRLPAPDRDIDFFYERRELNTLRLFYALLEFWNGDIP